MIQGVFWVLFEALGIFVGFDFCSVEKEVPRRKMRRKNAKYSRPEGARVASILHACTCTCTD